MTDQYQRLRRNDLSRITDPVVDHEKRLKRLEGLSPDQVGGTRQQIIVVDGKADTAQADALAAQSQALAAQGEALAAKADALEAASNALAAQVAAAQAVLDAAQAQSEIDLGRQVDPSNLFDFRPIFAQDASLFWCATRTSSGDYVFDQAPNITEWFVDGFTVTAPYANYRVHIGNLVPYLWRGGGGVSARFQYAFSGAQPATGYATVRPTSWLRYQGQANDQQIGQSSDALNLADGVASSGIWSSPTPYLTGPNLTTTETWRPAIDIILPNAGESITIRGFYLQAVTGQVDVFQGATIPDRIIGDKQIVRRMVGDGAIGTAQLDPSISFTPADGSITTAKLADGAATDAKIAAMSASKLTGTVALARLPAAITGRTNLGATSGQFTSLLRADGTAWVDTINLTLADVVTAASGYVFDDGSARRSGQLVELAIKVRRTSGNLVHATPFATLTNAYRTAVLADSPVNGIASGGSSASGMVATIIRSGTHATYPGGIVPITPASNNTIEVKTVLLMPAGT